MRMSLSRWMRAVSVILLSLTLGSCRAVVIPPGPLVPAPIRASGGMYVPWSVEAESHWQAVLACVHLDASLPRPSLWIIAGGMMQGEDELAGVYLRDAHVVLVSSKVLDEMFDPKLMFWLIARHEFIHAVAGDGTHAKHFADAERCAFWPVRVP